MIYDFRKLQQKYMFVIVKVIEPTLHARLSELGAAQEAKS